MYYNGSSLMLVAKEDDLPSNCCYANRYTKYSLISVYYRLQAFIWYIISYDNQLHHGFRGLGSAVYIELKCIEHSGVMYNMM